MARDKVKHAVRKREHYLRNKGKYDEKQRVRRNATKNYIQRTKVRCGCLECGEKHPAALVFHHRDPEEKEADSKLMIQDKWLVERIDKELAKCDVMCHNCHHKLHWRLDHPDNPDGLQILE